MIIHSAIFKELHEKLPASQIKKRRHLAFSAHVWQRKPTEYNGK
jgi:hypothetical protein